MLSKLLNSKFFQKLKTIKHIELYIVIFFIALLLIIYFSSFNVDKFKNSTSESENLNSLVANSNSNDLINLTQNYKDNLKKDINNLITKSINKNVEIEVCLKGGEYFYKIDELSDGEYTTDDLTIKINAGVTMINYEPQIDKIIFTNTQNLSVSEKITLTNLIVNYLNLNSNQIFLY